jgi:N,N'-diacetyllegionaminate synthase
MGNKTIIIAEAGVNHNGNIEWAKKLVDAAADAGADYVKFQTFKAEKLVSKDAKKAVYQQKNTGNADDSQFAMLKSLELSVEDHYTLKHYAAEKNIKFLSTGFDEESLDFLDQLGIDVFKVPSGELTNLPYLQHMVRKGKPMILSTGMATLAEIRESVAAMEEAGLDRRRLTVLHCNTEYPTPMSDVNLLAMNTIANDLGVAVGYSDHTLGIEIPIAAVALGATIIEKHFTLDRELPGPDHKASLTPDELKAMVDAIRKVEQARGDGVKKPSPSEEKNKAIARKSVFVAADLRKGEIIQSSNLTTLRPGDGLSPMLIPQIVGKTAQADLPAGTKLSKEHFK